jgi:hypothetical protein
MKKKVKKDKTQKIKKYLYSLNHYKTRQKTFLCTIQPSVSIENIKKTSYNYFYIN